MAEIPSQHELIQAARDNWNVNRGVDDETLRDLGYDTAETLPETIERVRAMGESPVARTAHLELVDENHTPEPGARREATLRDRPEARTARDKRIADADRVPDHIKVTPFGHDRSAPTVIKGGKADRR